MAQQKARETRVFVVEEQELYRRMYESNFGPGSSFVVAGKSPGIDDQSVQKAVEASYPDVILFGIKKLDANSYRQLEELRTDNPKLGFLVLLLSVDMEETVLLKKLLQKTLGGLAIYLKQSLDTVNQIAEIIREIRRRNTVIDPALERQFFLEKNGAHFLKNLTDREVEILGLLARGFTNFSIAEKLFIDVKTVEHHLNSIYGKLKEDADFSQRHPRVSIARIYLETTGELLKTKIE